MEDRSRNPEEKTNLEYQKKRKEQNLRILENRIHELKINKQRTDREANENRLN